MFFSKVQRLPLLLVLISALILSACNIGAEPSPTLDVNAINTAIVGTTVAQFSSAFTQTALANPPTFTPTNTAMSLPTFPPATTDGSALPTVSFASATPGGATPLAGFTQIASPAPGATQPLGDACNNNVFEGDISIPDGSVIAPGTNFQKIWKIRNTGTCLWDEGYSLVYIGGSNPNLDPYNFDFKKSGDFVASGEAINIGINLTTPCQPGKYEGHWRMRNDKGYYFGTILSVYVEVVEKCKKNP